MCTPFFVRGCARPNLRELGVFLAPSLIYLAVRQFGILTLGFIACAKHTNLTTVLSSWDTQWYLQVAANGYGGVSEQPVDANGVHNASTAFAFLPGYPWLVGLLRELPCSNLEVSAFAMLLTLLATICGASTWYGAHAVVVSGYVI